MQWTLNAPSTTGLYKLFARLLHGGADTFRPRQQDRTSHSQFGTSSQTGIPTVIVTSPNGRRRSFGIDKRHSQCGLRAVNSSTSASRWMESSIGKQDQWTVFLGQLTPATYLDGSHVINVTTAADVDGDRGSNEIEVTVNNAEESTTLLGWVWTMASGSLAIVAAMSVLIVLVLMVRKKKVEGRLR